MLTNNFVTWLFSNKSATAEEITKKMKALKVDFPYPKFCVLALKFVWKDNSIKENEEYEETKAEAIIEKCINTDFSTGTVYHDGDLFYVFLNYNCGNRILPDICINAVNEASENVTAYMVIGPEVDNIFQVSNSCEKIVRGLAYSYLYPDKHIFTYQEIEVYENTPYSHELLVNNMRNSLKCENYHKILSDFDAVIGSLRSEQCSWQAVQSVLLPLTAALNQFIYGKESGNGISQDPTKDFSNLDDFSQSMKQLLLEKNDMDSQKDREESIIINRAKKYISENLIDPQLSLETVAKYLNISPNYLSRYFHNECNITFVAYVTSLKMQYGRKLLLETDMKIEEISRELGYSTPQYFISKFKKQFGYTPNTYRLQLGETDSYQEDSSPKVVV